MKLVDKLRAIADTVQPQFGAIIADTIRQGATRIEAADPWARFGDIVFGRFWNDGEPVDVEGGDLQEIARECGLLVRTAEVDSEATHADGCEWQPGMPMDDCDCWTPTRGEYCAIVREQDGE